MCDNTNIHDQVQASLATATQFVDAALERVRATRQAILAQMVQETADPHTSIDEIAKAIEKIRKHNANADLGIYLEQGEYMDLMTFKRQVERVRELHVQETPITEFCKECLDTYPCPTIRALDGEQS